MSCPVDIIVTKDTQELIDTGLQYFSEKISKRVKPEKKEVQPSLWNLDTCKSNVINKTVLWANIGIQFVVLIFLSVIMATKGRKKWAFNVLKWISWITLILTAIQYKDGIMAGAKIFIFGIGIKTQIIVAISLAIVFLTKLLQSEDGGIASLVSTVIIIFIIARTVMQIQSALTNVSAAPVVLDFVNRVITVDRVKKLKNALR